MSKAAKRTKNACPLRINYLNISFLQKMLGNETMSNQIIKLIVK